MYISFSNIFEAFLDLATEHFCLMYFLFGISGLGNTKWIRAFLNGCRDRKVSEFFIISVILCPSSHKMCLRFILHFIEKQGCVLLNPCYLMSCVPKS